MAEQDRMNFFINEVRKYFKDDAKLNKLLGDVEYSDAEIGDAITDAIQTFNNTPPAITQYSIGNFPQSYLYLLKRGAGIYLLETSALLQARNALPYSDRGGIAVNLEARIQLYLNLIDRMKQRFLEELTRVKVYINVNGAYQSSQSEYYWFNG